MQRGGNSVVCNVRDKDEGVKIGVELLKAKFNGVFVVLARVWTWQLQYSGTTELGD